MKTLFFLPFLLVSVCSSIGQRTVLICPDYSGSVSYTAEQQAQESNLLRSILVEDIQTPGDKAVISYIYQNTASLTNQKQYVFADPFAGQLASDETEKLRRQSLLLQSRFGFIKRVINGIHSDAPKSSATHILSSIVRIIELAQHTDSLQVVYLSDMLEYSNYRNLQKLSSRSQAEEFAKDDARQVMEDFGLKTSSISSLEIDCYMPVSVMENAASYQYVRYYWETVFTQVFGENINLQFNTL